MHYLIESLKVTDGWWNLQIVWKFVLKMSNQHAELCPPVSNVINTENKNNISNEKQIDTVQF